MVSSSSFLLHSQQMEWDIGKGVFSASLIPMNFPHQAQTIFRNTAHLLSPGTKKPPEEIPWRLLCRIGSLTLFSLCLSPHGVRVHPEVVAVWTCHLCEQILEMREMTGLDFQDQV